MLRLTLRKKLLLFAVIIAIVPLLVAGRTIIRIAEDELKSSVNEQLLATAEQLAHEIDTLYERIWLMPLVLIRNAVEDETLGIDEKIALLKAAVSDSPDIVALQITIEGADLPLVVTRGDFVARLRAADLDPLSVLRVPAALIARLRQSGDVFGRDVAFLPETDDWLALVTLPLDPEMMGAPATLSARIDLHRMRAFISGHRFTQTGVITIVDADGRRLFDAAQPDMRHHEIIGEAIGALAAGRRAVRVAPYSRPDGDVMLGAYAFPRPVAWAVVVEKSQRIAYLPITRMTGNLLFWVLFGLGVATIGAIVMAVRMSGPILEIARVTVEVANGNFRAQVRGGARLKDEIGDLARRVNHMIAELNERFHLQKFVSGGTIAAIRGSKDAEIGLGGTRVCATMLFCDIRGYTAFAEHHAPDTVVEVLNFYFQHLADLVTANAGDIDKFVGDQILAVFRGNGMERNAVRCALAMQRKMAELSQDRPEWSLAVGIGINTGEVTMGAMGSRQRMDYTVLGDAVNLAARLCSKSDRGGILIGQNCYGAIAGSPEFDVKALAPMPLKGKKQPVLVYEVRSTLTATRAVGLSAGLASGAPSAG